MFVAYVIAGWIGFHEGSVFFSPFFAIFSCLRKRFSSFDVTDVRTDAQFIYICIDFVDLFFPVIVYF